MRGVVLALVLAACGDNQDPCDFHEADDVGNARAAEATGLALGDGATSVCGSIDGGHFDPATRAVDVDTYRVSVTGSGELLVQMTADPDVTLLGDFEVSVFADGPAPLLLAEGSLRPDLADHAAFVAAVPPGDIDVVVTAHAPNDISGSLPYRVRVLADPSKQCPRVANRVDYREALDGAHDMDNDVIAADFTLARPFSAIAGSPEPTGLDVEGGLSIHIAGSAGDEPRTDGYLDRDTYTITTDDNASELFVRLDWQTDADLDVVVFEADTLEPVATSTHSGSTPELQAFAVRPNASYWLWVARSAATGGGDPVDYDAHVCGGGFF